MRKMCLIVLIGLVAVLVGVTAIYMSNVRRSDDIEERTAIGAEEIEKLSTTRRIVVERDIDRTVIETITDKEEIRIVTDIFSRSYKETGMVTLEGNNWNIALYGVDGELIYAMEYWSYSGHFGLEGTGKGYYLAEGDNEILMEILSIENQR